MTYLPDSCRERVLQGVFEDSGVGIAAGTRREIVGVDLRDNFNSKTRLRGHTYMRVCARVCARACEAYVVEAQTESVPPHVSLSRC